MAVTIHTFFEVDQIFESAIEKAVSNVALIVCDELRYYILEDFYKQYAPKFYERTYSFLKSPAMSMLSSTAAKVFVNTDVMHYLVGEYGYTGEDIVKLAAEGYHGTKDIFREGFFWEDFVKWSQENIPKLLKDELKKQGLKIK